MSDIDAVIELLERWRDASGVGRLRIGVDATRVIAQLPPERKRALAIEVAERVAPQLVPAIASESGDLTAEQVGALVDLLRRADEQQLDDLVTALRTGEIGDAAEIVGDAVDVVAGPDEGTDDLLEDIATEDEPEQPEPRADTSRGVATAAGSGAAAAAGAAARDADAPAPPGRPGARDVDHDRTGTDATAVDADEDEQLEADISTAAAAAAAADSDHVAVSEDGTLELDEEAVRKRMAEEAAQRAQQYRDSSADAPRAPAYRAPAVDFITEGADFDFPDTTVESVAPIHERIERRTAGAAAGRLAAPPVSGPVASITATPDGYRRRRTALAAIQRGGLEADDVVPVVRSFERGTDRAWVAGAALDAGLVAVGALEQMDLSPAAIRRLQLRAR